MRPTTIVSAMLTSQSPNTIASPASAISDDEVERLRLHAGVDPAAHQRGQRQVGGGVEPVEHEPGDQRHRDRPQQPRSVKCVVGGPRLRQRPRFGSSLIGGSASTLASSSGLGGTDADHPVHVRAAPRRAARRCAAPRRRAAPSAGRSPAASGAPLVRRRHRTHGRSTSPPGVAGRLAPSRRPVPPHPAGAASRPARRAAPRVGRPRRRRRAR